jgi:hypothetical protein
MKQRKNSWTLTIAYLIWTIVPRPCTGCKRLFWARRDVVAGEIFGTAKLNLRCYKCNAKKRAARKRHRLNKRRRTGKQEYIDNVVWGMVNRGRREYRSFAHLHFDKLWEYGVMDRSQAYHWLALKLRKPESASHMSVLDPAECVWVAAWVHESYSYLTPRTSRTSCSYSPHRQDSSRLLCQNIHRNT